MVGIFIHTAGLYWRRLNTVLASSYIRGIAKFLRSSRWICFHESRRGQRPDSKPECRDGVTSCPKSLEWVKVCKIHHRSWNFSHTASLESEVVHGRVVTACANHWCMYSTYVWLHICVCSNAARSFHELCSRWHFQVIFSLKQTSILTTKQSDHLRSTIFSRCKSRTLKLWEAWEIRWTN